LALRSSQVSVLDARTKARLHYDLGNEKITT
jgi:hypothetical protein